MLVGAVAVCLLAVPSAQAGWLAPVTISPASEHVGGPQVALDSGGNATSVWDRWNGSETVVESAYRPAGAGWQAPVDLSQLTEGPGGPPAGAHDASSPRVAVDGAGDTTVVWERYGGTNLLLVEAAYRPAGGEWQESVVVGEVKTMRAPEPWVAVDTEGNATVTWDDRGVIRAAYRPVGEGWQGPVAVSGSEETFVPETAVDANGDATAVWLAKEGVDYVVEAAYRPAGGEWEAPEVLSGSGEQAGDPKIAIAGEGDALVAWNGDEGPTAVHRPASGSWGSPETILAGSNGVQSLRVALDEAGDALIAWSGSSGKIGAYEIAQASFKPAGGEWEAPVDISADGANSYPNDVVFDAAGNAAVVWGRSGSGEQVVQAAYRPVAGEWQASVTLSEEGREAFDAEVVLDAPGDLTAADGDATAIWTSGEGSKCGPGEREECPEPASYAVQAAGYDSLEPASEEFEAPATGEAGAPVTFTAPPTGVWSPMIDFGDGHSATTASTSHTYAEPGEYVVTFESNDVLGYRSSGQRRIDVLAAEGPPNPPEGEGEGPPNPPEGGKEEGPPNPPERGGGGTGTPPTEPSTNPGPSGACEEARDAASQAARRLKATREALRRADRHGLSAKQKRRYASRLAAARRANARVRSSCGS